MFQIGFSLWERAWTLRGFANMMMDFYDNPRFVKELLHTIAAYNIAHLSEAMQYDIDTVYFGDDWGQQRGLQMGPDLRLEFIFPELKRMYGAVRREDRYVFSHSLMDRYRVRLGFYGGLSTQKTLPYGRVEDVRAETAQLLEHGRQGDFILSPAHDVEGDVALENTPAFIETAQEQLQP